MTNTMQIIDKILDQSSQIRYAAVYFNGKLDLKQKNITHDSSSQDTDKYEELLVNPVLLKLASQRGNIDCGGLRYIIVAYGNFFQMVIEIKGGHVSICLDKNSDLNSLPNVIISLLETSKFT